MYRGNQNHPSPQIANDLKRLDRGVYSLLFLRSKYRIDRFGHCRLGCFGHWFEQPVVRVPPTVGVRIRMARARAGVLLRDGADCLAVIIVFIVTLVDCASFR